MSQPICETTGHPILFCDCEVHDPRPVVITPWNRAAESPTGAESRNPALETGVAQRGHGGPENGTPDLVAALRESIERARERRRTEPRPEFQALIDAFQPEYDALLKEDR